MRVKVSLINIIDAIRVPFCKRRQLYRAFYAILGFYPHRISLYRQALIHKSCIGKHDGDKMMHNERLEFLGDAVLDAVVGDIVYRQFQGKDEGFLTTTRSKLVQRETLGRLAVETGLDKLIVSHVGTNKNHNSYMEGNAFEALIGAVYLDRGYDYCMFFIERRVLRHLIDINKVAHSEVNFKSRLLEWSQKRKCTVEYELVRQELGENGSPVFYSRVRVEGLECGTGKGFSKKESQQKASQKALSLIHRDKELRQKIAQACEERKATHEAAEEGEKHDSIVEAG
ncbi:MAG: ribonuclease III [Bacteroidaceae bacterium]